MKTRHDLLMKDPEYRRLYALEALVTDAAELVARLMEEQRVNKAELARRLEKSRAWVTQLLSGKANMTIRTLAEVVYALRAEVRLSTQAQMSQHGETSLQQQWTVAFETPCSGNIWKVKPEPEFSLADLAPAVWAKRDYVEAVRSLGMGA
jgi:transcriptional regulator with XRE-family HTH domain